MPEPTTTPTPTAPVPAPTAVAPTPEPNPQPAPTPGATPVAAPAPVPAPAVPSKPEGVSDAEWAALGDPGKAAIVRERAAAAQAAADLAALRKEIEDSEKTQEQRDAEARAELERTSAANAAKALRYEVAAEKGIPLTAAARLVGGTREEIAADADRFLTDFPNLRVSATRIPAPDPGQGPRADGPKSDADQAYEAVYGPSKV